jgi:hypothetical protein
VRAGFVEYVTIGNPGMSAAAVSITFQGANDAGAAVAVAPTTLSVPAGGRRTLNVSSYVASIGAPTPLNLSLKVTSDKPVVCERPIYFSADPGLGIVVNGGTDAVGFTG